MESRKVSTSSQTGATAAAASAPAPTIIATPEPFQPLK